MVFVRLIFAGYGELGGTVLEALAVKHTVALVLTHPANFADIGEPHVGEIAARLGLPVIFSARAREPETYAAVQQAEADALVSTNWRTLLPPEIFSAPRLGSLNVHDALLPAYSGFGAVNWAIRNGERETGVTVHVMQADFDSGAVMVAQRVAIGPDDTAAQVYRRVLDRYVPATLEALDLLDAGYQGKPQHGSRTFYHRIGLPDVQIDWTLPSAALYNLVRAQSDPYINSWTHWSGHRLSVASAALPAGGYCGTPGRVIGPAEGGIAVSCGSAANADRRGLILLQVRIDAGEMLPATDVFSVGGGYLGRSRPGREEL